MKEHQQEKLIQLAAKAQQGNSGAFDELCREKGQSILYICIQTMGNLHDGEDAAQEVFIRMQKGIHSLQEPKAFSSWLHRLIINTCRDMGRKRMKDKYNTSIEEMGDVFIDENEAFIPQEYLEVEEKKNKLFDVIDNLPKNYRLSIVLFYFEGLSYAEIADAMDVDEKAVSNYLYRAKEAIRKAIEKEEDDTLAGFVLLPASGALGSLFKADAAAKANLQVVNRCIANSIGGASGNEHLSKTQGVTNVGGTTVGIAVAAAAVVALGAFTAWKAFAQPGNMQTSAETGGASSTSLSQDIESTPESSAVSSAPSSSVAPPASSTPSGSVTPPPTEPGRVNGVISGRAFFALNSNHAIDASQRAQGISLTLVNADNLQAVQAATINEADGTFRFENVPEGRYSITVQLPAEIRELPGAGNSVVITQEGQMLLAISGNTVFEISAAQTNIDILELPLNYAINIEGSISMGSALPVSAVSGMTVELYSVEDGGLVAYPTTTDNAGNFVFTNIILNGASVWGLRFNIGGEIYYPENPAAATIQLIPGRSVVLPQITLTIGNTRPVIAFQFVEGACSCESCQETARNNPGTLVLTVTDENMPIFVNFRIFDVDDICVYESSWEIIDAAQATCIIETGVMRLPAGEYRIIISAQDGLGNSVNEYEHPLKMIIS